MQEASENESALGSTPERSRPQTTGARPCATPAGAPSASSRFQTSYQSDCEDHHRGPGQSLLVGEVPIDEPDLVEDRRLFEQLASDVRDEFEPASAIENTLVELVVLDLWRLRRLVQAERAITIANVLAETPETMPAARHGANGHVLAPVTRSQLQRQLQCLEELEQLDMENVPNNVVCQSWAAQNRVRARHDPSGYLQRMPNNLRGRVRNEAMACEEARLQEMLDDHRDHRVRSLLLARHAIPPAEIRKRERDLRRSLMETVAELRARCPSASDQSVEVKPHRRRPRSPNGIRRPSVPDAFGLG